MILQDIINPQREGGRVFEVLSLENTHAKFFRDTNVESTYFQALIPVPLKTFEFF